jgi:hypothetical protein
MSAKNYDGKRRNIGIWAFTQGFGVMELTISSCRGFSYCKKWIPALKILRIFKSPDLCMETPEMAGDEP